MLRLLAEDAWQRPLGLPPRPGNTKNEARQVWDRWSDRCCRLEVAMLRYHVRPSPRRWSVEVPRRTSAACGRRASTNRRQPTPTHTYTHTYARVGKHMCRKIEASPAFVAQVRQQLKADNYKAGRITQLVKATRPKLEGLRTTQVVEVAAPTEFEGALRLILGLQAYPFQVRNQFYVCFLLFVAAAQVLKSSRRLMKHDEQKSARASLTSSRASFPRANWGGQCKPPGAPDASSATLKG